LNIARWKCVQLWKSTHGWGSICTVQYSLYELIQAGCF
jgi:hypothetical protein